MISTADDFLVFIAEDLSKGDVVFYIYKFHCIAFDAKITILGNSLVGQSFLQGPALANKQAILYLPYRP